MRDELNDLDEKQYLGDGVYAGYDGYQVVLWLEYGGGYGPDAIALEPAVLEALNRYVKYLAGLRAQEVERG